LGDAERETGEIVVDVSDLTGRWRLEILIAISVRCILGTAEDGAVVVHPEYTWRGTGGKRPWKIAYLQTVVGQYGAV
jgi:hypothetical protein